MAARHRLRFLPGSVRIRLTAWYALLLAAVLGILGFSVLRLTQDQLAREGDARLKKTAYDIEKAIMDENQDKRINWYAEGPSLDDVDVSLDHFESRALVVQICNASGRIIERSPSAPERQLLLAATPGPGRSGELVDTVRYNGGEFRVVRHPIKMRNDAYPPMGTIFVGERLDNFYRTLDSLRNTLLTTSIAGLAFAIVGGWVLADRALRPVDRVTATAARIASLGSSSSTRT